MAANGNIKLNILRGTMVRSSNKNRSARKGAPSYSKKESSSDKNKEIVSP